MISLFRQTRLERQWWHAVIPAVLLLAAVLGYRPSPVWLLIPVGVAALIVLLRQPLLGLFALILAALLANIWIGTGTEVRLNPAVLIPPLLLVVWLLNRMLSHDVRLAPSRTTLPLVLFLLSGLLSILIGNATWDPVVPRPDNFTIVQLGQWALWFFSAAAFWLVGNTIKNVSWLKRLMACFLIVAGVLGVIRVLPNGNSLLINTVTYAVSRAPFWLLLTALAVGQLLFNHRLSIRWRLFLLTIAGAAIVFAFDVERSRSSNWIGVAIVILVLVWLRFRRLRLIVAVAFLAVAVSGVLFQSVYEFAGGDAKWDESGGSRLALSGAVIQLTARNPVTGLGPAAYRQYGKITSLYYQGAYYYAVFLSSHNNYVDLYAQVGIIGLALFLWFMLELLLLNIRLRKHYPDGFVGGYVNSMLAAWLALMVIMALADWFLPYVYNLGTEGFQSSVLIWMFFGGLIAVQNLPQGES